MAINKSFLSMGFDELENDLIPQQQQTIKPRAQRVVAQQQMPQQVPQQTTQQQAPQQVVRQAVPQQIIEQPVIQQNVVRKPIYTTAPKMTHSQIIRDSIDVPLMAEFASKAKKGKRQSLQLYVYPDVKREVAKIMNKYNLSENAVGNILLRRALGLDGE